MSIDQSLLIPTLCTCSGVPSMTVSDLVALMTGETPSMPIDQTLLIPTLRGRAGQPAETIADVVALATGSGGSGSGFRAAGIPVTDEGAITTLAAACPAVAGIGREWWILLYTRDVVGVVTPVMASVDFDTINYDNTFLAASANNAANQSLTMFRIPESSVLTTIDDTDEIPVVINITGANSNQEFIGLCVQVDVPTDATLTISGVFDADGLNVPWPVAAVEDGGLYLVFNSSAGVVVPSVTSPVVAKVVQGINATNPTPGYLQLYLLNGPNTDGVLQTSNGRFFIQAIINP